MSQKICSWYSSESMLAKIQGLFKTLSWNSRTFQGFLAFKDFSRIYSKIQGLFKTVRTLSDIELGVMPIETITQANVA